MSSTFKLWPTFLGLILAFQFTTLHGQAQQPASGTIPVSTVVSVEARHGKDIPTVNREDVRVFQGKDRLQVTSWTPYQGNQAGLELLILIDESTGMGITSQFDDLR